MPIPERAPLTRLLKQTLEEQADCPVEVANAPLDEDGNLVPGPYIVIEPMIGGGFSGPVYCDPEADAVFPYLIRSCGTTSDSAEVTADNVRKVMLERETSGQFVVDLSYPLHRVKLRAPVGPAGKLDREGSVFCVNDTYSVFVTTSV